PAREAGRVPCRTLLDPSARPSCAGRAAGAEGASVQTVAGPSYGRPSYDRPSYDRPSSVGHLPGGTTTSRSTAPFAIIGATIRRSPGTPAGRRDLPGDHRPPVRRVTLAPRGVAVPGSGGS
ncbi:hypothetical protein PV721_00560, partial [Streptomyces sp. MB09-01]|nr:hypothetical protein [Streptomyces sp. MB09-01]